MIEVGKIYKRFNVGLNRMTYMTPIRSVSNGIFYATLDTDFKNPRCRFDVASPGNTYWWSHYHDVEWVYHGEAPAALTKLLEHIVEVEEEEGRYD